MPPHDSLRRVRGVCRREVLLYGQHGVDSREGGSDGNGVALCHQQFRDTPSHRRRNFGVHLVGGDLQNGRERRHRVADLAQPLQDGRFGDGLTELRHRDQGPGHF
ncbi:hypothetical protein AWB99_16600 [Mycolicibacterium confluentis]|nr:hypothetical protein AWB99_16600 [Mycolicibacterium confluentis]